MLVFSFVLYHLLFWEGISLNDGVPRLPDHVVSILLVDGMLRLGKPSTLTVDDVGSK